MSESLKDLFVAYIYPNFFKTDAIFSLYDEMNIANNYIAPVVSKVFKLRSCNIRSLKELLFNMEYLIK